MKFTSSTTALLIALPMSSAFMAPHNKANAAAKNLVQQATATEKNVVETSEQRPLYDPLGLYPESSEERQQGRILPLEPKQQLNLYKKVRDPMGLYPKNSPEFLQALQEEEEAIIANNERPIYDPMGLYTSNTPERQQGVIQPMEPVVENTARNVQDPMGLYPQDSREFQESLTLERESMVSKNRQLYDPLGLYPASSAEYQEGKIKALEPPINVNKPVLDPMGLYSPTQAKEEVDTDVAMSEALPFMPKPALLNGELVGDAGFDPLGLAKSKEGLMWQRQAELKHARIAMLAAAGWPLAELFHQKLANWFQLQPVLVDGDRVPSILNGGLGQVNPFYWMGILAVAGLFEAVDMINNNNNNNNNNENSIFDPLNLYPKDEEGQNRMQLAEIKNGRLAMMAITAFAAIEAFTQQAVVNGTPFLFHPPF